MLSNKYKRPLSLKLKPSKILFYFIIVIHVIAAYILTLSLDIHFMFLITVFIFICISLVINLNQNGFVRSEYWIDQIQFMNEVELILHRNDKHSFNAVLQHGWFSLPLMLVLYFKVASGRTKAIIILPDMLDKKALRQLKLHLNKLKA